MTLYKNAAIPKKKKKKCGHSIPLYLGIIKNVREGHDVMKANTRIEALLTQCLEPSKPPLRC